MATEIFKYASLSLQLFMQKFLQEMFRFLSLVTFYRIDILIWLPEAKMQNVRFPPDKLVCEER